MAISFFTASTIYNSWLLRRSFAIQLKHMHSIIIAPLDPVAARGTACWKCEWGGRVEEHVLHTYRYV